MRFLIHRLVDERKRGTTTPKETSLEWLDSWDAFTRRVAVLGSDGYDIRVVETRATLTRRK